MKLRRTTAKIATVTPDLNDEISNNTEVGFARGSEGGEHANDGNHKTPESRAASRVSVGRGLGAANIGFIKNNFRVIRHLGTGGSGTVVAAEHVISGMTVEEVALKIVGVGDDRESLTKVIKEISVLRRMNHPNVLTYKISWLEDEYSIGDRGARTRVAVIGQQLANGGSLENYIFQGVVEGLQRRQAFQAQRQPEYRDPRVHGGGVYVDLTSGQRTRIFSAREIVRCLTLMAAAICYVHSRGIVHLDLKPGNFLLHFQQGPPKDLAAEWSDQASTPMVLLADFGEAETLPKTLTNKPGTLEYMPPELLSGSKIAADPSMDMWSLGIDAYQVSYNGNLPWQNSGSEDPDALRTEIASLKVDSITFPHDAGSEPRVPWQVKHVITRLLSLDPAKRPSSREVLTELKSLYAITWRNKAEIAFERKKARQTKQKEQPIAAWQDWTQIYSNAAEELLDGGNGQFPFPHDALSEARVESERVAA
ncbi:putative serine/threonine-protein kinase iks1 [Gonapodya sp. JEL0774]|nr:putative serine/threonine-protein kinase iks1 [Gonapodya sp. JEL0774]